MKRKHAIIAVVASFGVMICSVVTAGSLGLIPGTDAFAIRKARAAVRAALIDPTSATFANEEAGNRAVCGDVNAKNSFGGYTGPAMYIFDGSSAKIHPEPVDVNQVGEFLDRYYDRTVSNSDLYTLQSKTREYCVFLQATARCPQVAARREPSEVALCQRSVQLLIDAWVPGHP